MGPGDLLGQCVLQLGHELSWNKLIQGLGDPEALLPLWVELEKNVNHHTHSVHGPAQSFSPGSPGCPEGWQLLLSGHMLLAACTPLEVSPGKPAVP